MKDSYLSYRFRFLWLAVFAVAMGFLEAIVVVYLRELYYPEGFAFPLKLMSPDLVAIEWIREIATLVMLAGVGIIAGRNNLQRLWYALFAFGVWDIFYYVALKLLIGWPASLLTWDLLFLIPVSWLGPVLAPVLNSVTMIIMALLLVAREEKGFCVKVRLTDWILIFGGALIILYTYLIDYSRLIIQSGILARGKSQESADQLMTLITSYMPDNYRWPVFIAGELMIVAAILIIYIRSLKHQ
ncbi:MAG: hypothetical protein RB288_04865 [Bacteroidales bacterium]|jgi:hypothetical protein|nr:hypothetical protein [Bacteroidales bacterium]